MSPAVTGLGLPTFVRATSADVDSFEVKEDELLCRCGSCVVDDTVAVLVKDPGGVPGSAVVTMWMVCVPPTASVPRSHVTVSDASVHVPAVVLEEM